MGYDIPSDHHGALPKPLDPDPELTKKLKDLQARRAPVSESQMKVFDSGAKRSEPMPDVFMMPHKALAEVMKRFTVGKKYGIHNWKKAQASKDLDFVRQFDSHGQEHRHWAMLLVDQPAEAISPKGDTLLENVAAEAWNVLCKLEYLIENEELFREAFSQYPEGHPKKRQDL
jgi:hypothetical protein